jgi:hypothetical protein
VRVVDFVAEAEQEAHEAFCWYMERDPRTGDRFEEAFVRAIVEIAEAPSLHPEIEPGIRRRLHPPPPLRDPLSGRSDDRARPDGDARSPEAWNLARSPMMTRHGALSEAGRALPGRDAMKPGAARAPR